MKTKGYEERHGEIKGALEFVVFWALISINTLVLSDVVLCSVR